MAVSCVTKYGEGLFPPQLRGLFSADWLLPVQWAPYQMSPGGSVTPAGVATLTGAQGPYDDDE